MKFIGALLLHMLISFTFALVVEVNSLIELLLFATTSITFGICVIIGMEDKE